MTEVTNNDFADQNIDVVASIEAAAFKAFSGPLDLSEDALALAFSARYRDLWKFCHTSGHWYGWDGYCWIKQDGIGAMHTIRTFVRCYTGGLKECCKTAKIKAIEALVKQAPDHAVNVGYWDADIDLLGTPDGVVDLRTGALMNPDPKWALTKKTAVVPQKKTPTAWLSFLHETTNGDPQMIRYLKQICGYALTGSTREHALFFIVGPGGNGKSVFLNTVTGVIGDYARASSMETFTMSKNDRHPTELAMLRGARLVTASETEEGKSWAEAKIKMLTGSDPIPARFMRQDFFEYRPQFKLMIVGNHAPQLRTVDEAIKRRFNFIPFMHKPSKPDRQLENKLRREWPQILNWMIEGCLDWSKNGLVKPDVVINATDEYFEEQDLFGQWLQDCCDVGPNCRQQFMPLYSSWAQYADARGEYSGTERTFREALKRNGFGVQPSNGVRWRVGVRLKQY
jgi:putative DNA primase/helicase